MTALVEQHPRRLAGSARCRCSIQIAVAELTQAVDEFGLRGVQVGTLAGDRELADDALEGFWARAEELDAVVFVHPWGCSLGERLDRYYLSNVVGNPVETTVALSHLVFSGLLIGIRSTDRPRRRISPHVPRPLRPRVAGTARVTAPRRAAEYLRPADVVRLVGLHPARTASAGRRRGRRSRRPRQRLPVRHGRYRPG